MQVTNEMVAEACFVYQQQGNMRAALEAALGEKKEYQSENGIIFRLRKRNVPYGWIELADIAASCIEDLARELDKIAPPKREGWVVHPARATLERWGLK